MTKFKIKSICAICIIALVFSCFAPISSYKSYGATPIMVEVNGECEYGYVDDGAAYYYFELPANGLTRIDVSSDGSVDFVVSGDAGFSSTVALDDGYAELLAGDYFVKIEGSGDFSIAVGFSPLNEYDKEPNNDMATAINMLSGTTYKGHVYYSYNDVDWYKLEVKTRSIVHFYLDQASGTTGYLFDENGDWVSFINGCANGLTLPMYGLETGTYYIKITPGYLKDYNYNFSARIVEYPTVNKIKSVTATGIGKAKVTWTKSNYAEGYLLYKESIATGNWSYVANLPAGTLSYVDYNAPYPGDACIYHICGYRYDPQDPYNPYLEILSEETNVGTKYTAALPVPKNVKLTKLNGTTIKIGWSKVSDVSGYKIYRKANGGNYKLVKTIKDRNTLYWKDTTVKKGINYTYKVRSYYNNGKVYNSAYSSEVKAKLSGTIAKPSNVKVKKYSNYNKLSWNKIRTATGYKIYRKAGTGNYKLVKTTTTANTISYKDKNVKKGVKYTYKVKAYYKNYTYNSNTGKYSFKTVLSKYSKIASVKR